MHLVRDGDRGAGRNAGAGVQFGGEGDESVDGFTVDADDNVLVTGAMSDSAPVDCEPFITKERQVDYSYGFFGAAINGGNNVYGCGGMNVRHRTDVGPPQ